MIANATEGPQWAAFVAFGRAGNAVPYQLEGWSGPEDGYTWAVGAQSSVRIPLRPGAGRLLLELTLAPMRYLPAIRAQFLAVAANGVPLGHVTMSEPATLGFDVPREMLESSGALTVTLTHPDSRAPVTLGASGDFRQLAFQVRNIGLRWAPLEPDFTHQARPPLPVANIGNLERAVQFCTALSVPDLMHCFESLGLNCEVGLMQRAAGAEPLGLLRFAGMSPSDLLRGLESAFRGMDAAGSLRVYTETDAPGAEYMIEQAQYSARFHTDQFTQDGTFETEAIVARFARHLGYLRRQFQDVLEHGTRIFVLQGPSFGTRAEVLPVLRRLRDRGPNVLLYVTEDRASPAGTTIQEGAYLFRGAIDSLATADRMDRLNLGAWISICANTYRMWREQGGGGP